MKNIVTALNNSILNERLKNIDEFNILAKDIQYQDGIFEIIESQKEINYLILSEFLPGQYEIKKLIEKIKEKNNYIKIILILENKKEELENYLYAKGIYKIYYNNKVEIGEIINLIKNDFTDNEKIIQELENLKSILIRNNIQINIEDNLVNIKKVEENNLNNVNNKNKIKNKFNQKNSETKNNEEKINSFSNKKIISILGTSGVGKSIVSINIANILKRENNKILILDFDILNNSLHTILGVNKYPKKIENKINSTEENINIDENKLDSSLNNNLNKIYIKELIINVEKNIDLISGINLLFDSKYEIESGKIKNILEDLKEDYDYIIIDTSSECFFEYTKNIISNSDFNIFLIESNLLEIKKAKRLLEIYNKEWNIEKNKINILINKYNKYSIKDKNIKNIFDEYKILGKINFDNKYNYLINKNCNINKIIKNKIEKDYKKTFNIGGKK